MNTSGVTVLNSQPLLYRIDAANRLTWVNEAWSDFARENQSEEFLPKQVLGQDLLGAFSDPTVRQLYVSMIQQVRSGKEVTFDYRCDVADKRRTFTMTIRLRPDYEVEFVSTLRSEESRVPITLLKKGVPRDPERFLRMCSWCQGVAMPSGTWLPVEEAVVELNLMSADHLPRLTHGMCDACLGIMMEKLHRSQGSDS